MQGPIVRYDEMKEALFGEHVFDYDTFAMGLIRAAWGYFKKLVIADTLITFIKFGFGYVDELSNIEAFLVILFYFIQDYCDFSGYMDISIGISQSMGVKLPENFARPYLSRGIDEYWRRWHMTLGAWFKDYVFYPLSISKLSLNIGRASKKVMPEFGKKIPAVFGLIIVWFLTGLWHGASWNYVLWGLYYGAIIILSVAFDPLIKKFYASTHIKEKKVLGKLWAVFQWLRTIFL
jgi:D-alanyl-lipoteichoic acid acyltransferase DltB (MBOAT superfamily)